MYIQVNPKIIIAAKGDTSLPCIPVSGINIWVNVSNYTNDTLHYLWSTGDTTTGTKAYSQGWYWVTVFDKDSLCSSVDSIYIDKEPCCAMPATEPYFGVDTFYIDSSMGLVTIANETLYVETVISIEPSAKLEILNSHLTMLSCSKIVVKRGATLTIKNSYLGGCGWLGIDIWGHFDACPGTYGPHQQGHAIITSSQIEHADVAVFLGNRIGTDYDARYIGGTLEMDSCHLKHNYVDVMISPFAVGAICISCTTPPLTDKWQSKITYNTFDTLAADYYCEPFVDSVLQRLDNFFNGGFPNLCPPPQDLYNLQVIPSIPVRCHFIDISPFVEYDISRTPVLQCADGCIKNGWESGTFGFALAKKITSGNTYYQDGTCRTMYNNSKFD